MPPWQSKKRKTASSGIDPSAFKVAWLDIGEGECPRCRVVRCMYRPITMLDFYCCAECSQVYARATLPDRDDNDLVIEEAA